MDELTPHELMCLFDALAWYSIRPEFTDSPTLEAFFLGIGDKIEKKLAASGYEFDGHVEYSENVH